MGDAAGADGGTPFAPSGGPVTREQWVSGLRRVVADIEASSVEWGIRPDSREGKFVSAWLGSISWLGHLVFEVEGALDACGRRQQALAEAERARVEQLARAVDAELARTQAAIRGLAAEREVVVARMMQETMPSFIAQMKQAVVVREWRWNDDQRRKRLALGGVLTLGLIMGGYGLRAWEGASSSTESMMLDRCLAHPVVVAGKVYCEVPVTLRALPP